MRDSFGNCIFKYKYRSNANITNNTELTHATTMFDKLYLMHRRHRIQCIINILSLPITLFS